MEEFIRLAEGEGHFAFFEQRQTVWNFIKKERLSDFCKTMKLKHIELAAKWAKKIDGLVLSQIEWGKWLSSFKDDRT